MTHSLIFPFLVLHIVNLLFSNIILLEVARELSRFCKMARRSKVVGPRCSRQSFLSTKRVYRQLITRYFITRQLIT